MMYMEMSRDEAHGGQGWEFLRCIWAPTRKENGSRWPFWSKVLEVKSGDMVLHLRGVPPNAEFLGYSIAAADGFETDERPPEPGAWGYSNRFFRADLENFTRLHLPVRLSDVFAMRQREIEAYLATKRLGGEKKNVFCVKQSGRLQCQNGAYLSDLDSELFAALFEGFEPSNGELRKESGLSVSTGQQLAVVATRLGQSTFSRRLKDKFGNACCFPSCTVSDTRFLVASHIARWTDNEELRGHVGNGLCLCLMHDKAFELGLFTLDEELRVYVNPSPRGDSSILNELRRHHGNAIRITGVRPLRDALSEHWCRVGISPTK